MTSLCFLLCLASFLSPSSSSSSTNTKYFGLPDHHSNQRLNRPSSGAIATGTTIVAVQYRDGVVVGADTRTSVSNYVSNRHATKVTFVLDESTDESSLCSLSRREEDPNQQEEEEDDDNKMFSSTCCVCRSGSAADTQRIVDEVQSDLMTRWIRRRIRPTVTNVAHLLRLAIYNDETDPIASLICAGYDHVLACGVIYSISPGGSLWKVSEDYNRQGDDGGGGGWIASGSGSAYVMGRLESSYPTSVDTLDEESAVDLVYDAIRVAMGRDSSSGGIVRLYVISKEGSRSIVRFIEEKDHSTDKKDVDLGTVQRRDDGTVPIERFAPPKKS